MVVAQLAEIVIEGLHDQAPDDERHGDEGHAVGARRAAPVDAALVGGRGGDKAGAAGAVGNLAACVPGCKEHRQHEQ
jgi:hypothetical protein